MEKGKVYRIAKIAVSLLAGYLLYLWLMGDFLRDSDCPEFTAAEAAIAEAFTLVRGDDKGSWHGGLVLEVIDILDQDECGPPLGFLGGGWIRIGSDIEISGVLSDTISLRIERDGPLSDPHTSLDPDIEWHTGVCDNDDNWGSGESGGEEIDRHRLAPFLEGAPLEIRMQRMDESELALFLVRDSGIVAVQHGERFWGDRGIRERVFLTVAGWFAAPPADSVSSPATG